jgi:hypothetical protein
MHQETAYEDPDCAHLVDPNKLDYLYCHRYPPKPNLSFILVPEHDRDESLSLLDLSYRIDPNGQMNENMDIHGNFTIVHPNAWCGEWQSR